MGGVLTYNTDVFPTIINYLGITEEDFITYSGENLRKLFDGKISTDEFWTKFSLKHGKKVKEELFGKFFNPKFYRDISLLVLVSLVTLVVVLITKLVVLSPLSSYLIPVAVGPMLIAMLISFPVAVKVAIFVAIISGIMIGDNVVPLVCFIIG